MTVIVGLFDMLICWTDCFQRQDGARRLQIETDNWTQIHQVLNNNWTQIHQVLNTRPFFEKTKQVYAAIWILLTLYVRDQLARFES